MKTINVLRCSFAVIFLLITCTARAATVSWTGAGGDNLWHNPTNWSGDTVPTFGDDVIVNVPGSPVITIDTTGVNIRSIQCAESLRLENATLALSDGSSTFAGPLHLAAGWISIDGASTVANVSGPTTWMGTSFYAYNGARFWLTNLTTLVMTNTWTTLQAAGADTVINLSNLTNVVGNDLGYSIAIHASGGGLVDLQRLVDLRGYFSAYSTSADSVVDLSGLTALGATIGYAYLTADGGTILVPKVTSATNANITVNADGQIAMPLLTVAEGSSFSTVAGAKLWLTNLTTLTVSNVSLTFSAQGVGSEIHVSNVTNLIGEFIYGNAYLQVTADQGGLVNLGKLHDVSGALRVTSRSAGSVVDLSGLSGTITGPERGWHNFIAEEGDILMPLVTGLNRSTVAVYGQGQVGFGPLNTAGGSSFFAYAGAKLWLTNLTELVVGYYGTTLSASGADSLVDVSSVTNIVNSQGYGLSINTYEGGKVDLHRLDKPRGPFTVTSQSPGSVVDLSGFSGTLGAPVNLYVAYGGVIFMPQVTAFYGVIVSVVGDGEVVTGPLTRIEGSAFYAYDGAKIWLTNLTTLTLPDSGLTLNARGPDSAIYLSNVTNVVAGLYVTISIHVSEGGLVDLQRLRNPGCVLNVYVQSVGSTVDLSGLTGTFTGRPNSWHSISVYGGSVLMPAVNALERINAYLSGEGSLVTAQLESLVNSTLSVDNATNDFSRLTNIVDSSISANTGAKLWLTNVTTLYITNGSVSLYASGAEAALYLPNVTNAVYWDTGYSLSVNASSGGEVDLRRLPNPAGRLSVNSSSSGSVVNLSAFSGTFSGTPSWLQYINASDNGTILMPGVIALDWVDLSISGDVGLPLPEWGSITSSRVTVQSGTNDFGGLTNVRGTSFYAYSGAKLWLTNLTSLDITNGSVTIQAWYDESAIHLPNVTSLNISNANLSLYAFHGNAAIHLPAVTGIVMDSSSSLTVYANQGGFIDLHGVGDITGGYFTVYSFGAGSVVDLSGITALTPRLTGSSLQTQGGGVILLNDNAVLIYNVALNFESSPNSIIPDFANPGTEMVLYAHAWDAYLIEARDTRVPNSPWQLYLRVPMTNVIQTVAARPPANLAFRVTPLLADPPALRIDRLADQQTQVTLFGLPGETYRVESKSALGTAETWLNGPTVTLTNAFRIFPEAVSAEPSRYYRARKL